MLGKEDYLCEQAFTFAEAMMRIFALVRRNNFTATNTLRSGMVEVDLLEKKVKVKVEEKAVDLTKSEYELLLFLIENRRRVVSKSAIAEHLSGDVADMFDDFNFVYAHIKNLKAKLASAWAASTATCCSQRLTTHNTPNCKKWMWRH